MVSSHRVVFRAVSAGAEDAAHHEALVRLPGAVRLRGLYSKGTGLTAGEADGQYRIRLYAGPPSGSCWLLELVATSLGDDARTPDVLHQGLDLPLPGVLWVTYELLSAGAGSGASVLVELLLET